MLAALLEGNALILPSAAIEILPELLRIRNNINERPHAEELVRSLGFVTQLQQEAEEQGLRVSPNPGSIRFIRPDSAKASHKDQNKPAVTLRAHIELIGSCNVGFLHNEWELNRRPFEEFTAYNAGDMSLFWTSGGKITDEMKVRRHAHWYRTPNNEATTREACFMDFLVQAAL